MKTRGFTIVELLIVIVVIGILAAISIVAYTGIQSRAVVASLTSDLDNSSKKLKLYQVDNSAYPIGIDCSATPAANTICLKSSNGTTYTTFTPNNTTNPQTFCLTATNGSTNYYINQDGTPASGACLITNLATNPSLETNSTSWGRDVGNGGIVTSTLQTDGGWSGQNYYRLVWTTGATGNARMVVSIPVPLGGGRYCASVALRSSTGGTVGIDAIPLDATNNYLGGVGNVVSNSIAAAASVWVRPSVCFTAMPNAATIVFRMNAPPIGQPVTGSILDGDAFMLAQGPISYSFADGSSPGWVWNGTANASTSTGPPL